MCADLRTHPRGIATYISKPPWALKNNGCQLYKPEYLKISEINRQPRLRSPSFRQNHVLSRGSYLSSPSYICPSRRTSDNRCSSCQKRCNSYEERRCLWATMEVRMLQGTWSAGPGALCLLNYWTNDLLLTNTRMHRGSLAYDDSQQHGEPVSCHI